VRRALWTVATAATLAVALGFGGPAFAQGTHPNQAGPATLCGLHDHQAVAGSASDNYFVRNVYWRGTGPACVTTDGHTQFTVTQTPIPGPRLVNAFPSIVAGCQWSVCSPNSQYPARVGAIKSIIDTWHTDRSEITPGADYNSALETWIGKKAQTTGHEDGAEVMIWLNRGGPCCATTKDYHAVQIDGYKVGFEHWLAHDPQYNVSWQYLQFRLWTQVNQIDNIDVAAFLRYGVQHGLISPSWYVENTEAGFEVWRGSGFKTTLFSSHLTAGALIPPVAKPPAPTPTTTPTPVVTSKPPVRHVSAAERRSQLIQSWMKRLRNRPTSYLRQVIQHPHRGPALRVVAARRLLRQRHQLP
jgi:hypothetical protein